MQAKRLSLHITDPVVHVKISWVTEKQKHPACTVGWVAQLYRSWLFPVKATQIPHGRNSQWVNTVVQKNKRWFKLGWSFSSVIAYRWRSVDGRLPLPLWGAFHGVRRGAEGSRHMIRRPLFHPAQSTDEHVIQQPPLRLSHLSHPTAPLQLMWVLFKGHESHGSKYSQMCNGPPPSPRKQLCDLIPRQAKNAGIQGHSTTRDLNRFMLLPLLDLNLLDAMIHSTT